MCEHDLYIRLLWMTWLLRTLHSGDSLSDDQLFNHAASQGWLVWQEHGLLRVDDAWAKDIPGKNITAGHLSTVDDAALFTMAMGELSASVNDFPLGACRKVLSDSSGFQDHDVFFQRTGELAKEHYHSVECNLDALRVAKFANSCRWNHESYEMVSSFTDRTSWFSRLTLRRYGLSNGMFLAALLDLKAFGLWLSRQNDPAIICPALSQFPKLYYFADQPTVVGLLGSEHPFLQLIGMKALHAYREQDNTRDWHYPLGQAFAIVEQAGVARDEFIWTVFSRLEEFERAVERAKEGAEFQAREGDVLAARAKESQEKWGNLVAGLENDISTLVHHFPEDGINEQQAGYVLEITRGQLRLPLRVAEELPEKSKKTLVQAIFKTFHSQAEIFKTAHDTKHYSLPYRWKQRVGHSARAFVHFHSGANIGRKFGSLAGPVEAAFVPYMHQPYLYHREHNLWMHVFGKLGLLYLYTLEIAETAVLKGEQGGEFLTQHMMMQALKIFRHYSGEWHTSLFDTLSLRVANLFLTELISDTKEELSAFVNHPCGYSVAKLLLIWTRPELLEGIENRGMHLFRVFDVPPHDKESLLERFTAYVNIMDRALLAAARMKDVSLSNRLVAEWEKGFSVWEPIVGPKWSIAPMWIQKALNGDKEGYTWLCGFPEFSNSMCKQHCDEMRSAGNG